MEPGFLFTCVYNIFYVMFRGRKRLRPLQGKLFHEWSSEQNWQHCCITLGKYCLCSFYLMLSLGCTCRSVWLLPPGADKCMQWSHSVVTIISLWGFWPSSYFSDIILSADCKSLMLTPDLANETCRNTVWSNRMLILILWDVELIFSCPKLLFKGSKLG